MIILVTNHLLTGIHSESHAFSNSTVSRLSIGEAYSTPNWFYSLITGTLVVCSFYIHLLFTEAPLWKFS